MISLIVLGVWLMVAVLALIIPIAIGVYVYRDATRRGMNALVWTLVAVFAPTLIGFIIYLVIREDYSDINCPKCNTKLTQQYVVCPGCGAKLKPMCDNCGNPIESEWKVCPRCTKPLMGSYDDVITPVRGKDKTIGKILILAIVIPVLLVVVILVALFGVISFNKSSMNWHSGALQENVYEEYVENLEDTEIKKILQQAHSDEKCMALVYDTYDEFEGCDERHYLVYTPYGGELEQFIMETEDGLFKDVFKLELQIGKLKKPMVYCIVVDRAYGDEFELYINGTEYECEVIKFDYSPIGDCFEFKPDEYNKKMIYE